MLLKKHKHPFLFTKDEMCRSGSMMTLGKPSQPIGEKNDIRLFNC